MFENHWKYQLIVLVIAVLAPIDVLLASEEACHSYTEGVRWTNIVPTDNAAKDLLVRGDRMFVLDSGSDVRLRIYDVSDPENPAEKFNRRVEDDARKITVAGDRLLVVGSKIQLWKEQSEYSLVEVTERDLAGQASDVVIHDGIAWVVGTGGIETYDLVADELQLVGSTQEYGAANDIDIDGNNVFVASGSMATIGIFDVGSPSEIVSIGQVDKQRTWAAVRASDGYAYGLSTSSELTVFDVSDPRGPITRGSVLGVGSTIELDSPFVVRNGHALVADVSSFSNRFYMLRVVHLDPDAPRVVAELRTPAAVRSIFPDGEAVHLAMNAYSERSFIGTLDVSSPVPIEEPLDFDTGSSAGIDLDLGRLYVARWGAGMEIRDPRTGAVVGDAPASGIALSVVAQGDRAFVAEVGTSTQAGAHLSVFDVSEQGNVQPITGVYIPDVLERRERRLSVQEDRLCLTNFTEILHVMDVGELLEDVVPPYQQWDLGIGPLVDVCMVGSLAYAISFDKMAVLDVTDITNVATLATIDRQDVGGVLPMNALEVQNGTAYIACGVASDFIDVARDYGQLLTVDVSDPLQMSARDQLLFPFKLRDVHVRGNRAFAVSAGYVDVIRVVDPDSLERLGSLPVANGFSQSIAMGDEGLFVSAGLYGVFRYPCPVTVPVLTANLDWKESGGGVELNVLLSQDVPAGTLELIAQQAGRMRPLNLNRVGYGEFRAIDQNVTGQDVRYVLSYRASVSVDSYVLQEEEVRFSTEIPSMGELGAYPNPFNPSTSIAFSLDQPGRASVVVFDTRGRSVRSLIDGPLAAGSHSITWDGTDEVGGRVASGVYHVRLVLDQGRRVIPVVMLK